MYVCMYVCMYIYVYIYIQIVFNCLLIIIHYHQYHTHQNPQRPWHITNKSRVVDGNPTCFFIVANWKAWPMYIYIYIYVYIELLHDDLFPSFLFEQVMFQGYVKFTESTWTSKHCKQLMKAFKTINSSRQTSVVRSPAKKCCFRSN